jgi:hypothetical protein
MPYAIERVLQVCTKAATSAFVDNVSHGCLLLLGEVNAVYKFGGKQWLLFTF